MDVEIGMFDVIAERLTDFGPVMDGIRSAFAGGVEGLQSFHMALSLDNPCRCVVIAVWDDVQSHRSFVSSVEGRRQQALLSPFFDGPPLTDHYRIPSLRAGLI